MGDALADDLPVEGAAGPLRRRTLARVVTTAVGTGVLSGGLLVGVPGEAVAAPDRRPRKRRKKRRRHHKKKHRPVSPTSSTPASTPPATPTSTAVHDAAPILDSAALHVVNRFTGGWCTPLAEEVSAAGGVDRWFAGQLDPSGIPDDFYTQSSSWWVSILAGTEDLLARHRDGTEPVWAAYANYERWSMVRRIHSRRQVLETMANFWEHHLHAPGSADWVALFRSDYGRMIRRNALGRFDTLLREAITHPAMGVYLGNAVSTKAAPNENLGRELLELHTVGRAAGYTEDDVKSSARILTGYRVDEWKTWKAWYDPSAHWVGPVAVLGFSDPNDSPDGQAVTAAYLRYLAHHPSTARNIARKLAVRFVSDEPSEALVNHLAQVYLANETAIAPVLRALVASDEFAAAAGAKMRTPDEDVVATYRALGVRVQSPTGGDSAANALLWSAQVVGMRPFGWPRPDGRPDRADDWSSVSRMLNSFKLHYTTAGGWWPAKDVTYRQPVQWLPADPVRFDVLVDHLARKILGRPASPSIQAAAGQATGVAADAVITADHALVRWGMARLLTVFLDSPTHFTR